MICMKNTFLLKYLEQLFCNFCPLESIEFFIDNNPLTKVITRGSSILNNM